MPYINMSLDAIPFSERTRNALMKNNIKTTNELRKLRDKPTSYFFNMKWIWRRAVNEIRYAIVTIESDFIKYKDSLLEEEDIKKIQNLYDYSDNNLYIPVKTNKSNWSYDERHKWKKVFNDYLANIYEWNNEFSLEEFTNVFLSNLSFIEIQILQNRLLFLDSGEIFPLWKIAEIWKITHERVRQIEDSLLGKLHEIFSWLSNTKIGIDFRESVLTMNNIDSCWVLDFTNSKDNHINGRFLAYIHSVIFSYEYSCSFLNQEHKTWEIVLIYKKNIIDKVILSKIFKNIDRLYLKKKPEDKIFNIEKFFKQWEKYTGYRDNQSKYEYCILQYLCFAYNIIAINQNLVFPKNKKDLKFLVNKELELLDEPIHFNDMYQIVVEKYPDYKWNPQKVHTALMMYGKNVGLGLYVKSSHYMKWWTIWDIAEAYLKKIWGKIRYSTLVDYIVHNKKVKKVSIDSLLFDQDKKKRFVKLNWWIIWLAEDAHDDIVTSWNIYSLDEQIYNLLRKSSFTEFTAEDILKEIWWNVTYQRVNFALKKLINQKKISCTTRGIVNYYQAALWID